MNKYPFFPVELKFWLKDCSSSLVTSSILGRFCLFDVFLGNRHDVCTYLTPISVDILGEHVSQVCQEWPVGLLQMWDGTREFFR